MWQGMDTPRQRVLVWPVASDGQTARASQGVANMQPMTNRSCPRGRPVQGLRGKIEADYDITSTVGDACELYGQTEFRRLLILERKRSERSGRPFLLVLLDLRRLIPRCEPKVVAKALKTTLLGSSREVDIRGWYESGKTIGVIYTEATAEGREPILRKVRNNLNDALTSSYGELVTLSWYAFPGDISRDGTLGDSSEPDLYRDDNDESADRRASRLMKRAVDICVSAVSLLLLSPLFLLIALLVKLTSRGPVFFKQARLGQGGRSFDMLKFRSMHVNNDPGIHREYVTSLIQGAVDGEQDSSAPFKLQNDPRVTAVGALLRKTSLDELPQLINVLLGDMSLVGPRPPIDYEVAAYDIWHRRRVLEVKPGITCI
ncbi:MAG: hypothetical protein GF331_11820, partial [Chitinivibrionales bacterium]|nr:hypothetical protein [Chitinivibrionales bacterium]